MGPVQAITTCFRKSFQFSGCATRSEFWWFMAFSCCLIWIGSAADRALMQSFMLEHPGVLLRFWKISNAIIYLQNLEFLYDPNSLSVTPSSRIAVALLPPTKGFVSLAATIVVLPATISALARRAHDIGWPAYPFVASFFLPSIILGPLNGYLRSIDGFIVDALLAAGVLLLFICIPVLVLSVLLMLKGNIAPNRYGPNPLEVTP